MNRTDRYQWLGMLAIFVVLGGPLIWLVTRPATPTDPPVELVTGADGVARATGRVEDAESASSFRERQPVQWFGDTPAGKARVAFGDVLVVLPDAAKQVRGSFLPARDQGQVGSCVSFGTATAIEHLMLVQIARGDMADYHDLAQEVIYAGSRVEIGGGRIRGDGSVGAWAAQFVQKYGVVTRAKHGKYDLLNYSESRCREWGRTGVPDDLEAVAKESPVKGITGVRNAEEAKTALIQGYPIAVCSDQGFASTRDKDGFARASGSWAHCMAVLGYRDTPRKGFLICNSWGPSWISGPKGTPEIPDGCFWCEYSTFDKMCRQNDTWAFSDAVGFPSRDPFFIAVPRQRDVAVNPKPEPALPALAY